MTTKMIEFSLCMLLIIGSLNPVIANEEIEELEEDIYVVTSTSAFTQPIVNDIQLDGNKYHQIQLNGLSNGGSPGEPLLPMKAVRLLLPPKTTVETIQIHSSSPEIISLAHQIEPAGEPVPLSQMKSASPPQPDPLVYNSSDPFPGELFKKGGTYYFRGYSVLVITLFPVQFLPTKNKIRYYSEITVSVDLQSNEKRKSPLYRGLETDKTDILNKIDNPEVIHSYDSENSISIASYDLLIITDDQFKEAFAPLKHAHEFLGNPTIIQTLTDIGSDNPEDIRDFIRDAYLNWGIQYVLIGGDSHIVPTAKLTSYQTLIPSDLYYACLDGTFNYDNDEYWGEPTDGESGGDVDLIAEVYVGRACVDDCVDVKTFVNKTIAYMTKNSSLEYYDNVLLVGENLGFGGIAEWGGNYMDELIDGSKTHGYETVGIPSDKYNIDTLYDKDWPTQNWPQEEIIKKINRGTQLINHLGHSGYNYNMNVGNRDVILSLTNNETCFIYSQGCEAGDFDYPYADCIAEYFTVKTKHGAFAGIWNSEDGFGKSGSTDGPSQRFHREFLDAIFGENITILGKANQDSKEDNLYRINETVMRWCYYELNYFGDPLLHFDLPDHNVGVGRIFAPTHLQSPRTISLNAAVFNKGRHDEANISVTIQINGVGVHSEMIPHLQRASQQYINYSWTPQEIGLYNITVQVSIPGYKDDIPSDDTRTITIAIGVQNLNTTECFATIQEAIDDSDTLDGHCIFAPSGIYTENIVVTKGIFLLGEDKQTTILQSTTYHNTVVSVEQTVGFRISNFLIQNGKTGISLKFCFNSVVDGNRIKNNFKTGIVFRSSANGFIRENEIADNSLGVHLAGCSNNISILFNSIHDNTEINIENLPNLTEGSIIIKTPEEKGGIFLENTDQSVLKNNTISYNFIGIRILGDSKGNCIIHNMFINNTENCYDEGLHNQWDDGFPLGGNYWSMYTGDDHYRGPDQDRIYPDGIGDKPYLIPGGMSADRYPKLYPFNVSIVNTDTGEVFPTIQQAVDSSNTIDGHHILVLSDTWYENIEIQKSIILLGLDRNYTTLQDGNEKKYDTILTLLADNVTVHGFTFQINKLYDNTGIKVFSSGNNIWGNIFLNINRPIILEKSSHNMIYDNTFQSGYINLLLSNFNTIKNNRLTSTDKSFTGIRIHSSNENTFLYNTIENRSAGIFIDYSYNNTICYNQIENNEFGIFIEDANNNTLYHNNLIGNEQNALNYYGNNSWDNGYPSGGNYWDDYNGTDSNRDGIGDIPYEISDTIDYDRYPLMYPVEI